MGRDLEWTLRRLLSSTVATEVLAYGCGWWLLQVVIVGLFNPNKHHGTTAFVQAMVPPLVPFMADTFDTLKD